MNTGFREWWTKVRDKGGLGGSNGGALSHCKRGIQPLSCQNREQVEHRTGEAVREAQVGILLVVSPGRMIQ